MKKLLSVSILAMIAVSPLAAQATGAYDANKAKASTDNSDVGIAAVGYVKGAYNAAIDVINAENARAVEAEGAINTKIGTKLTGDNVEHSTLYQNANETIHESLEALETAIDGLGTTAGNTYVTKGSAASVAVSGKDLHYVTADGTKVGENLGKLDDQVYTNTTNIGTIGDLTTNANNVNVSNLSGAVHQLDTKLGTVTNANLKSTDTNITTVVGAIAELNGAANVPGSVSYKVNTDAQTAAFSTNNTGDNAANLTSANTIKTAIDTLDTKLGTVSSGTMGTTATTVAGAIRELKDGIGETVISQGNYIGKSGTNTVSTALTALDTQVGKNTADIGATYDATTGEMELSTTAKTVQGAINEVYARQVPVYTGWNNGGDATAGTKVSLVNP